MEVREILEGMLDVLNEKEWIQRHMYKIGDQFYDYNPSRLEVQGVCLEGACHLAMPMDSRDSFAKERCPLKEQVSRAVIAAAAESCPEKYQLWMHTMWQFNDSPGITREDVILAVKTAITQMEGS